MEHNHDIILFKKLKKVYDVLQDDLSKAYFYESIRVALEHTGRGMGFNYLKIHPHFNEFNEDMENYSVILKEKKAIGKKICFYPVTHGSEKYFAALFASYDVPVDVLSDIDRSLHGTIISGMPVISPIELLKNQDEYAIIMTGMTSDRLVKYLYEMGIRKENIYDVFKRMRKHLIPNEYYFNHTFFSPVKSEVYVDIGAERGYEAQQFAEWTNGCYSKMYLFEPVDEHLQKLSQNTNALHDIIVIPQCAYSREQQIQFFESGESSHVLEDSKSKYYDVPNKGQIVYKQGVTIDSKLYGERVTFLRMDIEGSELQALIGAEQTIRKNKPRMAICIYHKPEDIFTIPQYILSLREDYKFYIRHHAFSDGDLVLYCV